MTNDLEPPANVALDPQQVDRRAAAILRGVQRMLRDHAFTSLAEVPIANGRRADVMGLNAQSAIWIVEIKSSIADFRSDQKWPEYRDYCDLYFFAVSPDFPVEILPDHAGLILADAYGGEIVRMPQPHPMATPRRKLVIHSYAMLAARRLHALADPAETVL